MRKIGRYDPGHNGSLPGFGSTLIKKMFGFRANHPGGKNGIEMGGQSWVNLLG